VRESGRLFRNAGQPGLSLLLVLLCLVMPAWAQAASAHLELDSRQLRVGQTATLRLVLTDGTARDVPHVPASEQLRISYQGQSQSYVSVNFRTTRMVTYQYAVTALQPGPAWVGPVEVELKDGRARAAILALSVEERDAVDPGAAQLQASLRTGVEQVQQPQEVWQGQTVVYELRFSHRDRVYDARWTQPDFEGFATEPTAEQTQREYRLQDAGGSVQVHEIHVPLVVTSVGKREIPPAVLTAQFPVQRQRSRRRRSAFDDIWGNGLLQDTRSEVLSSDAIGLRARPLPQQGRPSGFDGLVGSFRVTAGLSERQVALGDSVTLTVRLEGNGSLAGLRLPPMAEQDGFRAYDDEPDISGQVKDGRFLGLATLKRALVPTQEGQQTLPPLRFCWFDPATGSYVEQALPAMALHVLPGESAQAPMESFGGQEHAAQADVEALGEDILPIHASISPRDQRFHLSAPLPLILLLLPGLALALQLVADLRLRGRTRARRLRALRGQLASLPPQGEARLAAMEGAFREAAALVIGGSAAGITPERLQRELPGAQGEEAAALYGRLVSARYGGASPDAELEEALLSLCNKLLGRAR